MSQNLTFIEDEIYNLEKYAMIGGGKVTLRFNFLDKDTLPIDITDSTIVWTLSEFGQANYTILTKQGILSGDTSCNVVLESDDTKHLEGKFIHQITIIDYLGQQYIPCQGIIKISRNNNTVY